MPGIVAAASAIGGAVAVVWAPRTGRGVPPSSRYSQFRSSIWPPRGRLGVTKWTLHQAKPCRAAMCDEERRVAPFSCCRDYQLPDEQNTVGPFRMGLLHLAGSGLCCPKQLDLEPPEREQIEGNSGAGIAAEGRYAEPIRPSNGTPALSARLPEV